jgi:hypothetical protein
MRYPSYTTTPDEIALQVRVANPNVPSSPAQIEYNAEWQYLVESAKQASAIIERATDVQFVPFKTTKRIYLQDISFTSRYSYGVLKLGEWCLAIDELEWVGDVLDVSTYRPRPDGGTPFFAIRVDRSVVVTSGADFDSNIGITGTWGYHPNYAKSFTPIDTLDGAVNDSIASIIVDTPTLYKQLSYIKIGDELMLVQGVDVGTSTITVKRGVNGFTASSHDDEAQISLYEPAEDIAMATTRLGAWLYQNRTELGARVQVVDGSSAVQQQPAEVQAVINRYVWQSYGSL